MDRYLLLIIMADGLIWSRSSFGKLASGNFPENLGSTLTKFASKNPYPWIKDFLENIAIPNSYIFGLLTQWGELLTALSIIIASIYLIKRSQKNRFVLVLLMLGLLGGMFLNAVFWLASSWTSPSADGLNLLMFIIQGIGLARVMNLLRSKG